MDADSLSWANLLKSQGEDAVIGILQQASESIHRVNPDGTTLLHLFAMMGSSRLVRYLWDHGARPTVVSIDSSTLLHSTVRAKDESEDEERAEILECFLRGGRDRESESAGGEEAFVTIDVDHQSDRGWTALKQAARKKLERCVEVLLRFDADPDLADDEQYTALHNSADCGAIMKLLAVKSRNLNANNERGETSLYVACDRGTTAAALILLEHKADPNMPDKEGITPLFLAARNGNSELVKALVRAGAEVNKLGGSQRIGPLHWAAHKEYSEVALFLIERGGDVLLKDGEGRTPLSMASLVLAEKMIDVAKQHNTDVSANLQPDREAMSAKEKALGACCSGNLQALQALLENGDISVNMTCGKTGATLLHMAAYCGQANVAVFLLQTGANIQLKDMEQDSVLHFACMKSVPHGTHEAILELLLETPEARSLANARNAKGDTPLSLAARCGFPSRARLLLKYGADPLISNSRNELPFHRACTSTENLELVLRLAEVMPDVNVQDDDGWTPLMFACKAQCHITIQYLLQRGADPNIPQTAGFTALYLAAQENNPTICELLLEKGAKCNVQGGTQQLTPLHLAAHAGYTAVCCILAEHGADPHLKDSDGDSPLQLCSSELKAAILVGHERWVTKQQSISDGVSAKPSEGSSPSSAPEGELASEGRPPLERQVTNSKMAELEVEDEPNNELSDSLAAAVLEELAQQVAELQLSVVGLEGEKAALKAELAVLKDTAHNTSVSWPVHATEDAKLVLEEGQVQLGSLLYEDQWCAVSLAVYRCMEVTVTEMRGERKGDQDLTQGLAMLRLGPSCLKCPYIVLHLGVCHGPSSLRLLSEAMEVGTAANLIRSGGPSMTWEQTVRLVLDVASGLSYLHGSSPPLLHRHLRTSTVLVSASFRAKLSTEGLLRQFMEPAETDSCNFYFAPELMDGSSPHSKSSDVYTFGLLMYEIASRRFVYQEEDGSDIDVFRFTFKAMMGGRPQFADSTPHDYVDMATSCWKAEQHLRPNMSTVAKQLRAMRHK